MATFYHHHTDNTTELTTTGTGGSATGHDQLHHTFILMNPNFASGYPGPHQPQPLPPPPPQHAGPQSHNILLLNSAATTNHQFVRPMLPPQQDNITLYGYPQADAREITRPRQGLSLSLSSQQHTQYGSQPHDADVEVDVARSVTGSKYLKVAQELLEEVVNVGHGLFGKNSDSNKKWASAQAQAHHPGKGKGELSDEKANDGSGGSGDGDGESVQLSSADRQELQMKKAKLITMLDEAEQKYRQYHSQMQIVIHSFEQAAGVGSAKTYTALALKTISKQFRCLKDAIQGQIKVVGKSLGEGGGSSLSGGKIEGSRLKYIDHQIRQQRALQQLGVMQNHNAWRPQRGLPERSVSVLRAWLFEHFLHPYPKDSDKIMLAKQTGLTRSQVSNWFINARVRLWKPMIEEMYSEEIKEQEQNGSEEQKSNSHESNSANNQEKNTNITDENQPNNTLKDNQNITVSSPSSSSPSLIPIPTIPFKGNGFSFSGSLEMEGISQGSPKKPRNDQVLHCVSETELIKYGNQQKQERENNGYSILPEGMNFVGGGDELESYPSLGEMGRFTHEFQPTRFFPGNGISLSLGLPPCENQQLNITATNHNTFLSPNHNIQFRRTSDFGSMNSPPQNSTPSAFECLDIQNRKGFAAQLLQDFVA